MTRKYLIGGNWKCNGTKDSVAELVKVLNAGGDFPSNAEVVIAPPAIHAPYVKETVREDIAVSLQNCGRESGYGAYTGELCAPMIADFGFKWVITGHSERRVGFGTPGETSELVAAKTKVAVENGLSVMACVGEHLSDREAGNTLK
ncbi:unnamed protein product, partial [Phaeothamnion confervicola]